MKFSGIFISLLLMIPYRAYCNNIIICEAEENFLTASYIDESGICHNTISITDGIIIERLDDGNSTWFHVIAAIGTVFLPETVEAICNRTIGDPDVCGAVHDVTAALISIKGVDIFKSATKGLKWIASRGKLKSTATIETGIFKTANDIKTVFSTYQKIGCVKWDEVVEPTSTYNVPVCNIPKITVKSSSYLPSSSFNTYFPQNLVDGEFTTPWVENGTGQGIGEWVHFEFSNYSVVSSLMIMNGYNYLNSDRVGDRFYKNSRVKEATLEFSSGNIQNIILDDTNRYQSFNINPEKTKYIRLVIKSVYPGSKWSDTCLSEVNILFK